MYAIKSQTTGEIRFDRRAIFKAAWQMARDAARYTYKGTKASEHIGDSLRVTWKLARHEAKMLALVPAKVTRTRKNPKPIYVEKRQGLDPVATHKPKAAPIPAVPADTTPTAPAGEDWRSDAMKRAAAGYDRKFGTNNYGSGTAARFQAAY